jgi:hypothetical protein
VDQADQPIAIENERAIYALSVGGMSRYVRVSLGTFWMGGGQFNCGGENGDRTGSGGDTSDESALADFPFDR